MSTENVKINFYPIWEYKIDFIGTRIEQYSELSVTNTLCIAGLAGWELVSVSDGYAFYKREAKQTRTHGDR